MSQRRRLRPTFFLRCVNLLLALGIFWIAVTVAAATTFTLTTITILAIAWFIGIEAGVVPLLIESLITKGAEKTGKTSSLWFYDLDWEHRRERDSFNKDSSGNPTLR